MPSALIRIISARHQAQKDSPTARIQFSEEADQKILCDTSLRVSLDASLLPQESAVYRKSYSVYAM